jgi:signal peptidase I
MGNMVDFFIFEMIGSPSAATSDSMLDNIRQGDVVLWRKIKRLPSGNMSLKRGDILLFLGPEDGKRNLVKRCLGLPGETVSIKDNVLYINGKPLKEPYLKINSSDLKGRNNYRKQPSNYGPATVDPGKYFMLGDNRDYSYDSRKWGLLPESLIIGRAYVVVWDSKNCKVVWKYLE